MWLLVVYSIQFTCTKHNWLRRLLCSWNREKKNRLRYFSFTIFSFFRNTIHSSLVSVAWAIKISLFFFFILLLVVYSRAWHFSARNRGRRKLIPLVFFWFLISFFLLFFSCCCFYFHLALMLCVPVECTLLLNANARWSFSQICNSIANPLSIYIRSLLLEKSSTIIINRNISSTNTYTHAKHMRPHRAYYVLYAMIYCYCKDFAPAKRQSDATDKQFFNYHRGIFFVCVCATVVYVCDYVCMFISTIWLCKLASMRYHSIFSGIFCGRRCFISCSVD